MNPEEKALLKRTLELSEENHKILLKLQSVARRAALWGFVKLLIVLIPLVIGYLYLQPYFDVAADNLTQVRSLINSY